MDLNKYDVKQHNKILVMFGNKLRVRNSNPPPTNASGYILGQDVLINPFSSQVVRCQRCHAPYSISFLINKVEVKFRNKNDLDTFRKRSVTFGFDANSVKIVCEKK